MMSSRITAALAALTLSLLLLTACGETAGEPSATQTTGQEPATQTTEAQTTATQTTAAQTTARPVVSPENETPAAIHVNQVGYACGAVKRAIVTEGGHTFYVIDAVSGEPAFEGQVEAGSYDDASGDNVNYADFTALQTPGTYYLYCSGVFSYPFAIGDGVYTDVLGATLKAFYYMRCGTALDEEYAGDYAHAACHTALCARASGGEANLDVSGGWHDAGDYGRYVDTGAVAVGKLLYAYLLYPDVFGDDTGIPESGNGIPDVLDEAAWEISWMLKMQAEDGGVYDEARSSNFTSWVMPENDSLPILVYEESCPATASFCAVTALAARVYASFDAGFALGCGDAAKKAWSWVSADNTKKIQEKGGYVNEMYDEKAWAAAELYLTYGSSAYADALERNLSLSSSGFGYYMYNNMGGFVALALTTNDTGREIPAELARNVRSGLLSQGANSYDRYQQNPYEIAFDNKYGALSNSDFGFYALRMIAAEMARDTLHYTDAVSENLNYVLGKNALSQSYITGLGTQYPTQPHYRPAEADGVAEPVPGLVVGGAVSMTVMGPKHKTSIPSIYEFLTDDTPPMRSYTSEYSYWYFNEPTVYTNSTYVLIAAYLASRLG